MPGRTEAYLEMREAIVVFLENRGVATTEEIRFHCRETYGVVYQQLVNLRNEGVVQSARKHGGAQAKWRIKPNA
jgi:hypothetical protein